MNANGQIYLHAAWSPSVPTPGWALGGPAQQDAHGRACDGGRRSGPLVCNQRAGEIIMHHTFFWEEFIDEGGRNGVGGS